MEQTVTPRFILKSGANNRVSLFVADTEISEAQIAREMQHHRASDPHQSRAAAAQALVVRELLRLEAARLNLDALAQPLDRETHEEAVIRLLIERELEIPEPSEADCRRYYAQNRERLHAPDRLRVRHLLLAAAPDDVKERLSARAQAEALIAELQQHPERFTELAQRHSSCPSRDEGGELGWLGRGQTTGEFDRQLFMLRQTGLVALPIESRYGYHVVHVDEIERGAMLEFDQVAARIADYLEIQLRQNALQHYLQALQARYPVTGLGELLAAIA